MKTELENPEKSLFWPISSYTTSSGEDTEMKQETVQSLICTFCVLFRSSYIL